MITIYSYFKCKHNKSNFIIKNIKRMEFTLNFVRLEQSVHLTPQLKRFSLSCSLHLCKGIRRVSSEIKLYYFTKLTFKTIFK